MQLVLRLKNKAQKFDKTFQSVKKLTVKPKHTAKNEALKRTLLAMQESERIASNPQAYKGYKSAKEAFEDALNE